MRRARRGSGKRNLDRPAGVFFGVVGEDQLDEVNRYFSPPMGAEGFTIAVYNLGR